MGVYAPVPLFALLHLFYLFHPLLFLDCVIIKAQNKNEAFRLQLLHPLLPYIDKNDGAQRWLATTKMRASQNFL